MTSTSVKDVSTVMQSVQPATGFGAQAVKEGTFTEVFNRQTNRETSQEVKSAPERKAFEQTENVKSADGVNEAVKPETEQTVSEPQKQEAVEKAEMPDGEELEKAMEVLVTAAEQMITQLAQTFEISEEAVTQVMDELGMEPMDVLKPDMLSNLMLEIGGAQDSMELLTNEALYNDFKAVMSELETVLDGCAGQLDVLPEEISEVVQEVSLHFDDHVRTEEPEVNILSTPARAADESPVIEIIDETQITASDEAIVQEPDEETDIAGTKQFVETKSSVEMQDEMNASDMSRRGRQNDSNADRHENMMPAQVGQNRMQVEVNQTTQTTWRRKSRKNGYILPEACIWLVRLRSF